MKRRTVLIALGASVALLVVWYLVLWSPQSDALADAHKRTAATTATNEELQVRLSGLVAAKQEASVLEADFARMNRAVPDQPDLAAFILQANDAATEAGVDFLSIAPGLPSLDDPTLPPAIPLSITVQGDYFPALDYLDKLAALDRVVVIDTLGLTPGADATSLEALTISISARMFTTALPAGATTTVVAPVTTPTTASAP